MFRLSKAKTSRTIDIYIKVQTWNDECIVNFQTELNNANIYDMLYTQLHTDPTENLATLNIVISQAKDKHLPIKLQ